MATTTKRTTTIQEVEHRLSRDDIITLLRNAGYTIPDGTTIFVRVPGGGDWSNTDLDIEEDCPLIARFSSTDYN